VTGRAGTGDRTRIETSYAITSIDNDTLRSRAPSSARGQPGLSFVQFAPGGMGNLRVEVQDRLTGLRFRC
jgi:catecholate siderophore receptor